jgi:hypothetical protein
MVVTGEYQLGFMLIEYLPSCLHSRIVAVKAAREHRVVPVGEHALLLSPSEIILQPPHLRRPFETSSDETAHGVENYDVPLPEIVRVPTFIVLTGSLAKVVKVRSSVVVRTILVLVALFAVVVVSYGGVGDILETPPGWLVAFLELRLCSVLVRVVPEGKDGIGPDLFDEPGRSLGAVSSTPGDISRSSEYISFFVCFRRGEGGESSLARSSNATSG